MHDDVSAIPSGGCSVLTSATTISHYNGNTRKDFVQVGGVWHLYRTQTSTYGNYDISSYSCVNLESLNSYAVYQPILLGIAFCLFIACVALVIKTVKGFLYGI